jgi:hypothetical protein
MERRAIQMDWDSYLGAGCLGYLDRAVKLDYTFPCPFYYFIERLVTRLRCFVAASLVFYTDATYPAIFGSHSSMRFPSGSVIQAKRP